MVKERETKKEEEEDNYSISCECCTSSLPAQVKKCQGDVNKEEGEKQKEDLNSRSKLLIIVGLVLTILIVLLETFYDSAITHYVLLALATPVQFLLGRPFYLRFFRAIRLRKGFTTDTLVI
jgi:cation transport ATPase